MKIAVASGKGGTGKTTVSVNLAHAAGYEVCLLDCDVEEPNTHIFLKGNRVSQKEINILVPEIDEKRCTGCGMCSDFCAFNALVSFGTIPVFAPEMCHGCGGCARVCPQKAIHEVQKRIGDIEISKKENITLVQGRLDVGIALAPPLIRAVKKEAFGDLILLDAPPGTSCPVIETLRDADFTILVTEPTPFGLHDLKLAVETARQLRIPFGVFINRASKNDFFIQSYCHAEHIPVLGSLNEDRDIAETYARGETLWEFLPHYRVVFEDIWHKIREAA